MPPLAGLIDYFVYERSVWRYLRQTRSRYFVVQSRVPEEPPRRLTSYMERWYNLSLLSQINTLSQELAWTSVCCPKFASMPFKVPSACSVNTA